MKKGYKLNLSYNLQNTTPNSLNRFFRCWVLCSKKPMSYNFFKTVNMGYKDKLLKVHF
jgi:hypothetical protein